MREVENALSTLLGIERQRRALISAWGNAPGIPDIVNKER
jgi:hypothetical protein